MKIKIADKPKEAPPKFIGRFSEDGRLAFGSYTKMWLQEFMKKNPNMPFELKPLFPESNKQRKFFEGAICPLLAFYQEGMNHRNSKDVRKVREWLKLEFNGEMIEIGGKAHKIACSTQNKLNTGFLERVEGYIQDNYAPPAEALNPKKYKHWRDVVFPCGGADNYIDYLLDMKIMSKRGTMKSNYDYPTEKLNSDYYKNIEVPEGEVKF